MGGDPWAGMVDPKAALAAARRARGTLADSSRGAPDTCESDSSTKTDVCGKFSGSSHFSSPLARLKQFSGEKSKQKSDFSSSSYIGKTETYPIPASAAGLSDSSFDSVDVRALAKAANPLKRGSTLSDHSTIALAGPAKAFTVANTVPSPTAHLLGPIAWRDGLARLDRWTPPCEGFRSGEWEAVHRAVTHFMDHLAAEAEARGWAAIDLFGVHGRAGAARVDSCGALMLPLLKNATALTADAIVFGSLVYRRRVMPEAVLVWDLIGDAA